MMLKRSAHLTVLSLMVPAQKAMIETTSRRVKVIKTGRQVVDVDRDHVPKYRQRAPPRNLLQRLQRTRSGSWLQKRRSETTPAYPAFHHHQPEYALSRPAGKKTES
jgi:hypothetical protein